MDKFAAYQSFVAVLRHGGFAAAARELGMSRSSVNRMVIDLEKALGAQLFNRSTRQVSPTSDGLALYDRATQILSDLAEAEAELSTLDGDAVGRLRINAPLPFGAINVAEAVAKFMLEHPKVEVELHLGARIVDPVAEGFDLVVRVAQPDEETLLVDHRVCEVRYHACAAPSYIEEQGKPEAPGDLSEHAILHYDRSDRPRAWTFNGPEDQVRVRLQPILCTNNLEALLEATKLGVGIALLPEFAITEELKSGRLITVMPQYQPPSHVVQVIYPPTRHLSARVRLMTDYLIEWFTNRAEDTKSI